jgi:hypothetical protein
MNRLARNEIYYRSDVPIQELAEAIDNVSNDHRVGNVVVQSRSDGAG